ncbi:MAG: sensor domain-containing diguanylate cyclase [Candidatus Riflebacteria bacterium]|nr:sensor domain-containing diguanylate cyclase [Candidatus Riflebacteria bacterium]
MKDLWKAPALGLVAAVCAAAVIFLGETAPTAIKAVLAASVSLVAVSGVALSFLKKAATSAEEVADTARQEKGRIERDFQKVKATSEELKKRVMEVSTLMASLKSIARAIGQSLEYKKILSFVMDIAHRNIGAKKCSLWVVDAASREIRVEEAYGWTDADKASARAEWGKGVIGYVLDKKIPYDCESSKRDPAMMSVTRDSLIPSVICAPLIVGGEVVGILNIEEFSDAKKSGIQDEVGLANFLAGLVAMSIKNSRLFEQAQDKANTDGLTRLFTHRYFQEQLDQEIRRSERYGDCFSLILTDIDHFKKFNDTYGHQIGDLVLRETAGCFKSAGLHKDVTLARYGGEEFIVILPHTNKDEAFKVAEHLRKSVESRAYDTDSGKLKVNISLGVSTFPDDAQQKSVLIEMADHALYRAKKGGRNQVQLAIPEDRQQSS